MNRYLLLLIGFLLAQTLSAQIFGAVDETYAIGDQSGISRVDAFAEYSDGRIVISGLMATEFPGGISLNIARINSDGSFDPSFHGVLEKSALKLGVQPDGKVLVLTDNSFFRLNVDGSPDNSFVCGAHLPLSDFFVQPDGKIVVVEHYSTKDVLKRLDKDGVLDPSFKSQQKWTIDVLHQMHSSDILICGYGMNGLYKLEKLNNNGVLDASYKTPVNSLSESLTSYSDGRVVVVYFDLSTFNTKVIRLDSTGSRDMSFNCSITDNPKVITDNEDRLFVIHGYKMDRLDAGGSSESSLSSNDFIAHFQIAPTTNGRFLLAAESLVHIDHEGEIVNDLNLKMQRILRPDHLDAQDQLLSGIRRPQDRFSNEVYRFGVDGQVQQDFGLLPAYYSSWILGAADDQDRFIVADLDTNTNIYFYNRYLSNGSYDASFEIPAYISPVNITTTSNGKYLSAAYIENSLHLIRLEQDGYLDESFTPVDCFQLPGYWPAPDGTVLMEAPAAFGPSTSLYKILTDGTVDSSFTFPHEGTVTNAQWLPDGKVLVLTSDSVFNERLYRFNADFTPDQTFTIYFNEQISSFAVDHQGRIILITADSVLALQTDGRIDPQFQSGSFTGIGGALFIQSDDRIVFVGDFNSYNGKPRRGMVRLLTNSPLTIAEKQNKQPIYFAPNPSSGEVFIRGLKADKYDVVVYNSSGQLVARRSTDQSGYLDLSELKSGVYQLNVLANNVFSVEQFVKY